MGTQRNELNLPRGITIRRHASGRKSIQIAFSYKGRQCRETLPGRCATKSNVTYASNLLGRIRLEIAEGKFDYLKTFPKSKRAAELSMMSSGYTVAQMMSTYLKSQKTEMENSSWVTTKSMVDSRINPGLGMLLARDVTTDQIAAWIRVKLRGLSLKYVRNVISPLRQAFYQAIVDKIRTDNPAAAGLLSVKAHVDKKFHASGAEPDPLTKPEVSKLLHACKHVCVRNLFAIAIETGLRTGELIALRWTDIDFEAAKLTVRRAIVYSFEKGPKTVKGKRTVDLSEKAIECLKAQRELSEGEGHVFHHPSTLLPFRNSQQIWHLWKAAVESAEIRYRKPYQTRHTYASQMISRTGGVNLFYLADQMGHKGIEMINRHYGRWIQNSEANGRGEPMASSRPQRSDERRPASEQSAREDCYTKSQTQMPARTNTHEGTP